MYEHTPHLNAADTDLLDTTVPLISDSLNSVPASYKLQTDPASSPVPPMRVIHEWRLRAVTTPSIHS